ncbi:MAG: hypothetical protein JNG89_00505, partial [Planctomycetaceae bacterium]|nr:hypothetical protein [Planctomycetaceae bacterium]
GEDGTGRRARGAGGTVRRFSLSGRDSQQLLDLIDQAWHTTQPNRIEVVPIEPISPVRGIERPADETSDAPDDRRRPDNEPVSRSHGRNAAQLVAFVNEGNEPAHADAQPATGAQEPAAPEAVADDSRREIAPGIFIQVQGDELILMSEDEEALDRLEQMLEETLLVLPATTSWKLFMLQSADATSAAEMLEQLMPDASVSQVSSASSSSGFFGSLSSMGNSLISASGLSSSPAGGLRIIPDLRQNALYVSGPASKVAEVREFLRFIDASDIGGTLRDRVPHMIAVKYAEVTDVHRVVREVYRDYLEGEPAAAAANPFAMLMGGGGRGGRDQQQQQPKEFKLTVGMDEQTSHLIVSADEGLYQEILELVTSLDNAARDARRTVRVVELENASTSAVQNTLGAVMPRVRVSSSGARTSRTDSSSSNNNGNGTSSPSGGGQGQQQQGPSQDQMRQYFEQRMRERMMGGGNNGGGGDGQQRSFFFGGNRGGGNQGGGDGDRRRGGRN